jgi:hypothetical protein
MRQPGRRWGLDRLRQDRSLLHVFIKIGNRHTFGNGTLEKLEPIDHLPLRTPFARTKIAQDTTVLRAAAACVADRYRVGSQLIIPFPAHHVDRFASAWDAKRSSTKRRQIAARDRSSRCATASRAAATCGLAVNAIMTRAPASSLFMSEPLLMSKPSLLIVVT